MRRGSTALTSLLFVVAVAPAAARSDTLDSQQMTAQQLACAFDFQATSDASAPNATTLHLRAVRPLRGTVRLYGATQLWTAAVGGAVTAVNRGGVSEEELLIRTTGPVLGVEFRPEWAPCSMIAAVRPRAPYDPATPSVAFDAQDGGPTASVACSRPFGPARVVRAVEPDTPAMAQQQGIQGIVNVAVALDATGQVVATAVQRSPSAILNNASMMSARRSTYEPAMVACRSVPSAYQFNVSFSQR